MISRTHTVKEAEIVRRWWLIDAEGQTLGRLASNIAGLLLGKGKPDFSPHMEMGDSVVVIQAERVRVTGKKLTDKIYYRHTGYPGGLKSTALAQVLEKHPERVIEGAVEGMLPKNKLGRHAIRRLHVYAGTEHPHFGQKPQPLEAGGSDG